MFLDIQNSPEKKSENDLAPGRQKKEAASKMSTASRDACSILTSAGQHSDRASTGAAGKGKLFVQIRMNVNGIFFLLSMAECSGFFSRVRESHFRHFSCLSRGVGNPLFLRIFTARP
jgi:hypothetical protein